MIDDDPLMRFSLVAYLEDSGFACLEAGNGPEGLEVASGAPPDAVVTDFHMPGTDGLELVSALVRLHPGMPVIVLTGSGGAAEAREALDRGAMACLVKPLPDLEVLAALLASALGVRGLDRPEPPEGSVP